MHALRLGVDVSQALGDAPIAERSDLSDAGDDKVSNPGEPDKGAKPPAVPESGAQPPVVPDNVSETPVKPDNGAKKAAEHTQASKHSKQ